MLKIAITKNKVGQASCLPKNNWIKQVVKETLKQEGVLAGEISIVLGDDELLKRLNKEYRGINKPTDVLSFSYDEDNFIGEVIISIDAVCRQAEEYNHSFEKELSILLIHGVLHTLGYDHSEQYLPQEPMAIRTADIMKNRCSH